MAKNIHFEGIRTPRNWGMRSLRRGLRMNFGHQRSDIDSPKNYRGRELDHTNAIYSLPSYPVCLANV
jgi:hypothetical protein